ncbi:MAG: D-alanine--D-alanine ligase [Clostridiales bacterium]|nr:D-alanine--D-alanine ligase [Clostridiales bacterium]
MKINVAVLFGGKSVEHEVSIISAVQAMQNINKEKYCIYPVYITKNNEFYYGEALFDIEEYKNIPALLAKSTKVNITANGAKTYLMPQEHKRFSKLKPIAVLDAAFPIVHGTNVEDGALQGFIKTCNLPFVGCDVLASAICMDKYIMKVVLKEAGFPVLDGIRFSSEEYKQPRSVIKNTEDKFGYPVVVKPVNLGSSVGISKADNTEQLEDALELAFQFSEKVLIEPAVVNLKEINCSVLGDYSQAQASELEEPVSTDGILSYKDKYLDGGKKQGGSKGMTSLKRKIPADIPADAASSIKKIAVEAFKYLDCSGVVRIDFLMDSKTGEFWINEFNTIPGSLAFYLWEPLGMSYSQLLDKMISVALKRARLQENITYSFDTNILSAGALSGAKGSKGAKR